MSSRLRVYVRQHHVALLALFVAMSGTAYAAVQLPKNVVKSKHIGPGQVKGSDIATNAVSSQKVADGSLLGADFAPGQFPAGLQGPQGTTGPQGATGPQGPTGPEGPSTGPASGDLSGNYPNPLIASGAVNSAKVLDDTATGGGLSALDLAANSVGPQETNGLTGADIENITGTWDNVSAWNARQLDGRDSSVIPWGSPYWRTANPAGTVSTIEVFCDPGDRPVGGGFDNGGNEVSQSYPTAEAVGFSTIYGWHVQTNWATEGMVAWVVCLNYG